MQKQLICPHKSDHDRRLIQRQEGITYLISCCSICAGIALRANCEFEEIVETKMARTRGSAA